MKELCLRCYNQVHRTYLSPHDVITCGIISVCRRCGRMTDHVAAVSIDALRKRNPRRFPPQISEAAKEKTRAKGDKRKRSAEVRKKEGETRKQQPDQTELLFQRYLSFFKNS